MGIRFEKDTILNWINEMGKFLRLIVDRYEHFDPEAEELDVEKGYKDFFLVDRSFFVEEDESALANFADGLEPEQVRPLAQLLMYDGLLQDDKNLLKKAKFLFERNMSKTGAFSFEDYGFLAKIDQAIAKP
ncbi:hypothetical protein [Sphingobacterium lactis]|uniref:Uncharacterized protein n=1 Tax=Sphingobacterium lactis TaxID=797291 RepID=A0A1H5SMW3_9SPHI|nr:hypothetical protein [Sphingobacterium lactis]SEF51087.1 hypothetical protein SAMN05421877_101299 [Sphingobacterium lactis]